MASFDYKPPVRRAGKPYIWVTWLAGLLGGKQCVWSAWFMAHFSYTKQPEEESGDLQKWSRDHDRLVAQRRRELEEAGFTVTLESENEFKLEGATAIVAGKPDLVGVSEDEKRFLVVDGKTGRQRDSDWWQVMIYLFAMKRTNEKAKAATKVLGEVQYQRGDVRKPVTVEDLETNQTDITNMIKLIAAEAPPARKPSADECKRCKITAHDCPDRYKPKGVTRVDDF